VDIRTVPGSRRNPQFDRANLPQALTGAGIHYEHRPGLGGLRHARKDSINTAWRNESFRGFADYMQTSEFSDNLDQLIETARNEQTAIMCAESVPWRCHRSLVADALTARRIEVRHIISGREAKPHSVTPFARIEGQRVTYPGLDIVSPL
jgi:uncharacterized protein (DUF488 family)